MFNQNKQGFEMKNKYLAIAVFTATTLPAHAYLQVSPRPEDIGKLCYSEHNTLNYRLYSVSAPDGFWSQTEEVTADECASTYAEQYDKNDTHCWVGVTDGVLYHCYPGDSTDCIQYGPWETRPDEITDWTPIGENRVGRGTVYDAVNITGDFSCNVTYTLSEYGCANGFYSTNASAEENMTCTPCPQITNTSTQYTSALGNTSITGCYIPSGASFSDNTGSGTYTNNCYYSE